MLKGASKILAEVRPIIFIECDLNKEIKKAIGDIFNFHNYKLYSAEVNADLREELREPTWNTIAIPQ